MVTRGSKVFIDACAIAGALHTRCWKAVAGAYQLETTENCLGEVVRRNFYGAKLVDDDPDQLRERLTVSTVSADEIGKLDLLIQGVTDVHDGEKSLLVLALKHKRPVLWVCGPDAGTLRAMHYLHKRHRLLSMDQMCSLETLARGIGLKTKFEGDAFNLSDQWLERKRMQIMSG